MSLKIISTSDQSQTLYNDALDETYHSRHGAYQESVHVYITSGLDELKSKKQISVFEMGFGTGLNVLLTQMFAETHEIDIHLTTIELYPLGKEIWSQLEYARTPEERLVYTQLHEAKWEEDTKVSPHFSIRKKKVSLLEFTASAAFDIIYWDAFGPEVQPELWTLEVFQKLFGFLALGGILVTYSAKGQVRRNMVEAGFKVDRLPGPPGKREMLRAVKSL
jgi:tRNA U34 5-methylaminomethyl-2-thiouridine-forming methyltransferase MnmC